MVSSSPAHSSFHRSPLLIGTTAAHPRILDAQLQENYQVMTYRTAGGLVRAAQRCPSAAVVLDKATGGPFGPELACLLLNENPYLTVIIRVRHDIPAQWKQVLRELGRPPTILKEGQPIREHHLTRKSSEAARSSASPRTQCEFSQLASLLTRVPPSANLREVCVILKASMPCDWRLVAACTDESSHNADAKPDRYEAHAACILELIRSRSRSHSELSPQTFSGKTLYVPIFLKGRAVAVLCCHRNRRWVPAQRLMTAALLRVWATTHLQLCAEHRRSDRDPLTGAGNRNRLFDDIPKMVRIARQRQQCLGIAFIDLEQLKEINRRHGYNAGDRYLKQAADAIARQLSPGGRLYRYGGDEFVALVIDQSSKEVKHRLKQAIVRATQAYDSPDSWRSPHSTVFSLSRPTVSSVRNLLRTVTDRAFCNRKS